MVIRESDLIRMKTHLADIHDPRRAWGNLRHRLADILVIALCCVIIGVVIGTVSLTGLGLQFGYMMLRVVGPGDLLKCAIMVALMSNILGMGIPGIAAYVIVTAVAIPVMVNVGFPLVASHLFCLIYASLSNITPPVAISAYVASGIAGANQTVTSWLAVRVAISGFLLPFYFLLNPVLLIGSAPAGTSALAVAQAVIGAAAGVMLMSAATEGWLIGKSNWIERGLCVLGALLLIDPGLTTSVLGAAAAGTVIVLQVLRGKKKGGVLIQK